MLFRSISYRFFQPRTPPLAATGRVCSLRPTPASGGGFAPLCGDKEPGKREQRKSLARHTANTARQSERQPGPASSCKHVRRSEAAPRNAGRRPLAIGPAASKQAIRASSSLTGHAILPARKRSPPRPATPATPAAAAAKAAKAAKAKNRDAPKTAPSMPAARTAAPPTGDGPSSPCPFRVGHRSP